MANHGAGNKFVSINLNKSYGKISGPANSSSYGASRVRSGIQAGGGGGMVVLSRPRSSQKTGQKLSVPSPINLPSMRKEHEKFDLSGAGSGSAGGAGGSNSRPSSAGMGWTKPAALILQEKGNEIPSDFVGGTLSNADAAGRGGGVYVPPARSGGATNKTVPAYRGAPTPVEKVAILRGEDFPSLHTSLSTESGHTNKLKDVANKKTKQLPGEHLSNNRTDDNNIGDTRTDIQGNISQQNSGFGSSGNDVSRQHLSGPSSTEDSQKQVSYYNGSLPEVRLNPRYDWADDERDTGHVITDISRNQISQKNKEYWERDFDMPRGMPPKPAPYAFNKWGQRSGETGKIISSEMFKADPYNGDARPTSKEGRDRDSWNNSASSDRFAAPLSNVRGRAHSVSDLGSSDRKNMSSDEGGRQPWNNSVDPAGNKGGDRIVRDQFRGEQIQRYNSNNYQNASQAKSTSYVGGKGLLENDPVLNFSKVKKLPSTSEELYLEDPFAANWSGELMGVVKRKKDVPELAEFHDPARESFEAELERVQQMQERERKRAIEEQQRAMEVARRQEDERLKLAREQEERQMRLEEEAREAAWRAEQEQQEANQKTIELRIAREEEKQRMQMEEERRKQGAMQKLLELEEKIARRKAEATKEDTAHAVDEISGPEKEIEASRAADISGWEDSERMVESITASALCDSSGLNKFVESGSRSRSFADTSVLPVRGKSVKSWRRDTYEIEGSSNFILHNQDNAQRSPGRDTSFPAKNFSPRKDVHGGSGLVYPQNYASAGVLDHNVNDPFHLRRQSWNFPGERDHYDSNPGMDLEAHVDADWGGSSAPHHAHSIYQERSYQSPKLGEVGSYSRSRYSIRQPRVLPPPTLSSMNRPLKREVEQIGLSTSIDRMVDNNYLRDHSMERRFDDVQQEQLEDPEMGTFQPTHTATRDQLLEGNHSIRCDSQSSLSVTSPPSAPTHLSHEDSRSTPDSSAAADIKAARPSSSDPVVQNGSFFNAADDGDWIVETHENLQVQEVYDEGGEYQEVDEVHTEDEDIDLNEEFEALNLENKDSPQASENLILGFNEGIEVEMPSEESDGNQKESRFTLPQFFNNADSMLNDGQARPRSSTEVQKTEELTVGSAVESNGTPPMFLGRAEAAVISGQPLPISAAPSPVSQIATSTMPAAPNRPDVPVQLQLGLFSGQSLIQSPVPAIQIGSIQMPLHLHPPMGSSLPHQSTPLFQFGQLRYNTPVLQGITPLVPQTVSFVQPTMPGMYASLNPACPVPDQPVQQSSQSQITNKGEALATNSGYFCETNRSLNMDLNSLQGQVEEDKNVVIRGPSSNSSKIENDRVGSEVNLDGRLQYPLSPDDRKSSTGGGQLSSRVISPLQFSSERVTIRSKAPGSLSGSRGKGRESYSNAKSFGPKSSTFVSMAPRMESSRSYRKLQRRDEHQVPENADRRLLHNDERMNFGPRGSRMSSRNGSRRGNSKLAKHTTDSDWPVSGPASTNDITIGSKAVKEIPDKSLIIGEFISRSREGHLKRNVEEDIEVPLQSRFVRVYEQPGIEIPSDEDDFIEVRSKRQMLNDRREQREKENKAKSRLAKNSQKPWPSSQNTTAPRNNNKILRSFGKGLLDEVQPNFIAPEVNGEPSARFDAITVSHPLAPIGTPSHSDGHCETMSRAVMPGQVSGLPVESSGGKNVEPGVAYETKSNVAENIEGSLSNWNNTWVSQLISKIIPFIT